MPNQSLAFFLAVAASSWSLTSAAQTCPSTYSACDNGGCCLSTEQCCPTLAEGCCSSATPFCCGDGTCAATPSQCNTLSRDAECDGYAVPCGGGCAPAGSDCCDSAGHYCPPESMCTSDTTCVLGDTPTLAREVAVASEPEAAAEAPFSAPFADPPTATERSCRVAAPGALRGSTGWLLLLAGAALLRARQRVRRGSERRGSER